MERISGKDPKHSQRKQSLTYKEVLERQSPQRSAQSSRPFEEHRTGWDDEIVDPPRAISDANACKNFYQGMQRITKDTTIDNILALIPRDAVGQDMSNHEGTHQRQGFLYMWTDPQGNEWKVCVHSPDYSFLTRGWSVRVQRNNWYMDSSGNFYDPKTARNWRNPQFDEDIAQKTHFPIQTPNPYRDPFTQPNPEIPCGQAQLKLLQDLRAKDNHA